MSRSFVKVLALSVQNQTSEDDALKGNCNDFKIRELQAIAILHLGGGGGIISMNWRSAPTIQWSSYSPKLEVSYGGSELGGVARVHIVQVQCPHLTALWCNYNQLGIWKLHLWNLQCFKSKCVPNYKFLKHHCCLYRLPHLSKCHFFFHLKKINWNSVLQLPNFTKLILN